MHRRSQVDEGVQPPAVPALLLVFACSVAACSTTAVGDVVARRARPRLFTAEYTAPAMNARALREVPAEVEAPRERDEEAPWSDAVEAVLTAPRARTPAAPPRPWDHATAPRYVDRVERRFGLTAPEREALARDGFVVPERVESASYAAAYRAAQQAELPVYVSADSILHAVASLHAPLVAHLEEHTLAPMLARVLQRMHEALASSSRTLPDEAAGDADLVLTVARSLLEVDEGSVPPALGPQPAIAEFAAAARAGARRAERYLFGRPRAIDFAPFEARGRYARSPALARYFRATQWLSRVELNLVSRACRSSHPGPRLDARETPREALAALALAELVTRADAREDLSRLEQAWSLLNGRRDDVSLAQVNVMRDVVRVRDLRAADTFERFRLVARNAPATPARAVTVPDGAASPPVIASLFGARARPGVDLPAGLVAPTSPRALAPTAAEAAWVLGVGRARAFLEAPIAASPDLADALQRSRDDVPEALAGSDLASLWLRALTSLNALPLGRRPSFMGTEAFADLRMNTVIASYGELLGHEESAGERAPPAGAAQAPTAWVDPAPEVYAALGTYAERALAVGRAVFEWSDRRPDAVRARDRALLRALDNLSRVTRALRIIADDELAGRLPDAAQTAFLARVADADAPPLAPGGWYAALFASPESAQARAEFAAEWSGAADGRERTFLGAQGPRMGVFVIDNGGLPFVAAGPVARAWELTATPGTAAPQLIARSRRAAPPAWTSSWLRPQDPAPPLALTVVDDDPRHRALIVRAPLALGPVTLELLDPHGAILSEATRPVLDRPVRFALARRATTLPRRLRGRRGRHDPGPRYIDNTRVPDAPQTLRVRTTGFWYELPLRFTRDLHITLGGAAPIDARGDELSPSR